MTRGGIGLLLGHPLLLSEALQQTFLWLKAKSI